MTEEEKQFVRKVVRRAKLGEVLLPIDVRICLTLLIESEAMRRRAEFYQEHLKPEVLDPIGCATCILSDSVKYHMMHGWSNADWIAAVKKEIGM